VIAIYGRDIGIVTIFCGRYVVKVQDLDGATCTSCYWTSSACTTRWSFQKDSGE